MSIASRSARVHHAAIDGDEYTTLPTQLHASVARIPFPGAISCVSCSFSVCSPPYQCTPTPARYLAAPGSA